METPRKSKGTRPPSAPVKKSASPAETSEQTFVDAQGIPLENLLTEKTKARLRGKKILYVVQPQMDVHSTIVKFGRGGMSANRPNSAFSRLQSYRISYGDFDEKNLCTGVRCFFLAYGSATFISKLENMLKKEFKNQGLLRRGTERIEMRPAVLVQRIKKALKGKKTRTQTAGSLRLLTPFKTVATAREQQKEGRAVKVRVRKLKL